MIRHKRCMVRDRQIEGQRASYAKSCADAAALGSSIAVPCKRMPAKTRREKSKDIVRPVASPPCNGPASDAPSRHRVRHRPKSSCVLQPAARHWAAGIRAPKGVSLQRPGGMLPPYFPCLNSARDEMTPRNSNRRASPSAASRSRSRPRYPECRRRTSPAGTRAAGRGLRGESCR